ncbi:hypothetical protein DITRI_Ditri13aG0140000 [Diplodiscus trichospermus]
MRKRGRENPCGACGHYHRYEEGEVCGICGHNPSVSSEKTSLQVNVLPSVILPDFLYLGSYDNASRSELLKSQGISRILNTFPACPNLYKHSFTYHCLQDDKVLQFDDANQFLDQCERDKARVLVHCMSGKNRSAAIVIAYLMKSRRWRLPQSCQWVKERRSYVELSEAFYQQLQEYEQKLFGSPHSINLALPNFRDTAAPSINFGSSNTNDPVPLPHPLPAFHDHGATTIFDGASSEFQVPPHEFRFGAGQTQGSISESLANPSGNNIPMDST